MDHPDALPQGNARHWPALYRGAVGCLAHLEIINARDVLDNAVAGEVPNVHAESKMRLGFHGQVRLDSSWPTGIYTPMLLRRVAFPDFCEPCLPSQSPISGCCSSKMTRHGSVGNMCP